MEHKSFRCELKALETEGEFEGYAAVFGNEDMQGDVIEPGAFRKTLQENGGRVPILWQHRPDEPIGIGLSAVEDERGLRVRGRLALETARGREAWALIKQGVLRGLSIGYDTIKEAWEGGVRRLKEVRLWEWSLVTFPANPLARVTGTKAVVPFQDLPLADMDRSWDADAAVARVRRWAGGPDKEEIDWGKYRKAFVWYDAENPENYGSYKLPIADVIDGRLMAVPRAIFAAAAVVQGARGGVDIPEGDIPAVKRHLARYYAKMDRTPPWESESAGLEMALYTIIGASQVKYGRVLSERNLALVRQAIEALQALLAAAEPSDDTRDEGKEPSKAGGKPEDHLSPVVEELRSLVERMGRCVK